MKKIFCLICSLLFIVCLVGCDKEVAPANDETVISREENISKEDNIGIVSEENTEVSDKSEKVENVKNNNTALSEGTLNNESEQGKKILLAFFSRADEKYSVGTVDVGNTEIMAGFIKDYLGDKADTFKIDPETPYPADYKKCTEVATKEKDEDSRPEFKNASSLDLSQYDTIILGYPIWWGDVPMIINTFLEKYDFSGKTVYLFNTHEGSGNSGTYSSIKSKLFSADVNTNGLAIRGADVRKESSRSTVENWLKGLGL
ncbi:MAG: NAD(P)H-dependent oxidoreductase [Clostridia bacterium]|nr:NAD(P)H-dependent oxidoreductase [Clostridia bacterium]